jgi:serine O-acetyltransferase
MPTFDIDRIATSLREERAQWRAHHHRLHESAAHEFPSPERLARVVAQLRAVLFPLRLGPADLSHEDEDDFVRNNLREALDALYEQGLLEARQAARGGNRRPADVDAFVTQAVERFGASLSETRRLLDTDVTAAFRGDPAAHSVDEVLLSYPGVHAMIHHRLAHTLYRLELPLIARIVSERAHSDTGIDIHPGASIGPGFFIDHGTGVVIGETAVIGREVRLYQAVTLGAKRFPRDTDGTLKKGLARHPIVEDHVVIYAGATILGNVTIGRGAVIGGNVWITDDVPAGASVTQAGSIKRGHEPKLATG